MDYYWSLWLYGLLLVIMVILIILASSWSDLSFQHEFLSLNGGNAHISTHTNTHNDPAPPSSVTEAAQPLLASTYPSTDPVQSSSVPNNANWPSIVEPRPSQPAYEKNYVQILPNRQSDHEYTLP